MKTIKKYAMGGAVTTTTDKTTNKPVSNKRVEFKKTARDKEIEKTNKGNASGVRAKSGAKIKKAQNGNSSFAKLAPPYDKATFADKIAGAKKNAGTAKSGAKMKSGGKMKTCKGGC
jgi:hypothetical protein